MKALKQLTVVTLAVLLAGLVAAPCCGQQVSQEDIAKAAPQDISLNGLWDFTYKPSHQDIECEIGVKVIKTPDIPRDPDFEISIKVPGYWEDNMDKMKKTSWWPKAKFNPGYKPAEFSDEISTEVPPGYWRDSLGYWEYETEGIKKTSWWPEAKFYPGYRPAEIPGGFYSANPLRRLRRHGSTPYLLGAGWYRREIDVPKQWHGHAVTLTIGGVITECYLYVNGRFVEFHRGYLTPFQFDLTNRLNYGERNEIMLEVVNLRDLNLGSIAMGGYHGRSAGICGVKLHISGGPGKINNLFLRPIDNMSAVRFKAELKPLPGIDGKPTQLSWLIKTLEGNIVKQGLVEVTLLAPGEVHQKVWDIPADGIRAWSIWDPYLYNVEIFWRDSEGNVLDSLKQSFGSRSMTRDNKKLYLNGRPVMLRGLCSLYSFSPELRPKISVEYFRKLIRKFQEIGYNHIRFNAWVPPQEYMQAADELGMLLQVELPKRKNWTDFELDYDRWRSIVLWSRVHPSVVIYCGGNEIVGHEGMIAFFEKWNAISKELDPGSLFIPMECMRPIAPEYNPDLLKVPDYIKDPNKYRDELLECATNCSDIFAITGFATLSYSNFRGWSWREQDPYFESFKRPVLQHELGIIGNYLDIRLEDRYNSTLPNDLYIAARKNLEGHGRLHMAQKYYENSCLWQAQARKYMMEKARKCENLAGYDYVTVRDTHSWATGYSAGVLNDFMEFKYGNTVEKTLQYNGESAVLLDNDHDYVFWAGDSFARNIMVSLYGGQPLKKGVLKWRITDGNKVLLKGSIKDLNAPDGRVTELHKLAFTWPDMKEARKVTLSVSIGGYCYPLNNQWDLWVFPRKPAPIVDAAADKISMKILAQRYTGLKPLATNKDVQLRIVNRLTSEHMNYLAAGGDVLLLGVEPFPSFLTEYQIAHPGRSNKNVNFATVINYHPIFSGVPNDGFCDWQFLYLMNGGKCIVFDELPIEFNPILEMVSSYKLICLKAALWEAQTEGGRLFVASCNFNNLDDPATVALLDGIMEYVRSNNFRPKTNVSVEKVLKPLLSPKKP